MVEETAETVEEKPKTRKMRAPKPEYCSLKSLFSGVLIITQEKTKSGTRYTFSGAGSVRDDILIEDRDILLSLRRGTGPCCGSGEGERRYFIEA